jgi:hypothetical protein
MFSTLRRLHLADFAALFASSILIGALTGGLMNALNGWISPAYFSLFFYYPGGSASWAVQELYWHIIWQGCKEGLALGCVISLVFTTYVFVVSKSRCRFGLSAPFLPKMATTVLLLWFIGGFNGVVIGLLFPNFLSFVTALGGTQGDRLRFLWVGGSINGAYFGSLLALICGCHWFKRAWWKVQPKNLL